MREYKYGIGLVSYNMSTEQIETISSSINQSIDPVYLCVVDNSPTDVLKEKFVKLGWCYIHSGENLGFGRAHNLIFQEYGNLVDYHLILNPDVIFGPQDIEDLCNFMENTTDAGCVMPKVRYPNGEVQFLAKLLPSPLTWILRRVPYKWAQNYLDGRYVLRNEVLELRQFKVPFVSGCFLLFRVSSLMITGFFDERFFLYAEDTDLSRRLWESKNFPYFFADVEIQHGYQRASARNLKLFVIHIVSAWRYFNKWGWNEVGRKLINDNCLSQFERRLPLVN